MSAEILLAVGAVGAVASVTLAATAIALPPTHRETMLRTLAAFGAGRVTDIRKTDTGLIARLRPPVVQGLQRLGDLLAFGGTRAKLSRLLDYAGNPPDWPLDRVIRTRVVTASVLGLLGLYLGHALLPGHGLFGGPVAAVIGLFLPDLLAYNAGVKRQLALTRSLPDTLDALVIGVEAGLGLDSAMLQVAAMLRGPMPDEIHRVLQEMKLGVARTDALRSLAARTTVRDLKTLVNALVQAGELGISVAGILREHAHDQRLRRRQRAEEQAQKVAVKLLFPVLFCLFPVIFIVVLGPAVLSFTTNFK
ncbi:type II secretion system F family protein [Micromonosporaceae bacterium Da 78-11]